MYIFLQLKEFAFKFYIFLKNFIVEDNLGVISSSPPPQCLILYMKNLKFREMKTNEMGIEPRLLDLAILQCWLPSSHLEKVALNIHISLTFC